METMKQTIESPTPLAPLSAHRAGAGSGFACHIHPCHTAKERELAMRIAQKVQKTHASDREDLVEDLRFTLSAEGLEEARLKRVEDHTEVIIEGRILLSWFPEARQREALGAGPSGTSEHAPLTTDAAAIAYRYSPKTLRIYQRKGWLPEVLTHAALREFKATLCKGRRKPERVAETYRLRGHGSCTQRRKRSLLERWRKSRVTRKTGRSCMSSSRGCGTQPWRSVIQSGPTLRTLIPLTFPTHPREYYLRDVTAELALRAVGEVMLGNGPPGAMALAHSP